eukprot:COSAG05_NODE_890_length_6734_cov_2.541824_4_plen_80_part_00
MLYPLLINLSLQLACLLRIRDIVKSRDKDYKGSNARKKQELVRGCCISDILEEPYETMTTEAHANHTSGILCLRSDEVE